MARRAAAEIALSLGFGENEEAAVALIVGEMGSNVLRHGRGGEMLLRPLHEQDALGLEVIALDRGPGMSDIDRCMRDGYSTGGTLGTGLGVVRRLAHDFDIYSRPGAGTAIMARVWKDDRLPDPGDGLTSGVVRLGAGGPLPELEYLVMVEGADGHAAPADEPAQFRHLSEGFRQLAHQGATRWPRSTSPSLAADSSPRAILVLHTSGLASGWTLASYPRLLARHPSLAAGVLYRDFAAPGEPVTIVTVARESRAPGTVLRFEGSASSRASDYLENTCEAS